MVVTTSSPGFERDAELGDLQRLAGVARDRELLGIAAELGREAPPHALDVGLEDLPHVVHGRLVRDVEVALERLVHDARARTAAAVVQVDDRAVEREGLLDLAPVGLVGGDARRRLRRDAPAGRLHAGEPGIGERGGRRQSRAAGGAKEPTPGQHLYGLRVMSVRPRILYFPRRKGDTIQRLAGLLPRARRARGAVRSTVLRLAVGAVFVAHGAQKLFGLWGGGGLTGTAAFFAAARADARLPPGHFRRARRARRRPPAHGRRVHARDRPRC